MASVREEENFSVRAEKVNDEEIAALVDTFNTMLDHIQERDSKLKAHQRNLEKTVDIRTREMRKAKDAAIAANTAKSDFLATMSHEIRTPMNGMLAMADLLSKAPLAPRYKRYAEVIAKSGQGLLAIINDILDLSKIEAGRLDLEVIPVRPAEIIDDVVGLFWERAASKNIDLAAYVAPNTPEQIEGDPVRINQVLSNLVNNALKFTQTGHVIVAVSIKQKNDDGSVQLEFSVTDTGAGIPKEKQAAIFEAFSQADQSTTRRYGGTGLGLAICQRLAEAMHGKLGLTSKPGKGSRFFFSIKTKALTPAHAVKRSKEEKRAVIAIGGDATPKMLALYLREAGVIPHIVDQSAPLGPHIAYADMIFASPEFYHVYENTISEGKAQWVPARICVCELGDTAPDRLVERKVVEDILLAPLSRQEVMAQIERILENRMRGAAALAGAASGAAMEIAFKGQRILAADDSAVNREVVAEALKRLNLEVTLAENGREALALAREREFSLILMDCSMPEMDGFEATKAIRAFEQRSDRQRLPIVALTAHVSNAGNAWREAGMDDYLTKPFTLDSLAGLLSRYLEPSDEAIPYDHDDAANRAQPRAEERQIAGDLFDLRVLDQIASMQSSDGNLPVRTLSLFEEHSQKAIKSLAASMKEGDAEAVAKAAHAIKSMSLNVGANVLADACGQL
ncbi:MAG: ATP-binding protein, partial [Pseudomonadota bacterium]